MLSDVMADRLRTRIAEARAAGVAEDPAALAAWISAPGKDVMDAPTMADLVNVLSGDTIKRIRTDHLGAHLILHRAAPIDWRLYLISEAKQGHLSEEEIRGLMALETRMMPGLSPWQEDFPVCPPDLIAEILDRDKVSGEVPSFQPEDVDVDFKLAGPKLKGFSVQITVTATFRGAIPTEAQPGRRIVARRLTVTPDSDASKAQTVEATSEEPTKTITIEAFTRVEAAFVYVDQAGNVSKVPVIKSFDVPDTEPPVDLGDADVDVEFTPAA